MRFSAPEFPKWLTRYHELVALADEGRAASGAMEKNWRESMTAPDIRDGIVKWLQHVADSELLDDATKATASETARPIREWLGGTPPENYQPYFLQRDLDAVVKVMAAAAARLLRNDSQRALAFVSFVWKRDRERLNADTAILKCGMSDDLGITEVALEHLASAVEGEYILDTGTRTIGQHYMRMTQPGREWFIEQLAPSEQIEAGPWWMWRDEPNQKWDKLGGRPAYDRDAERAVDEASPMQPLSLLFVDFDNLKKLNSDYGNTKADLSLGAVIDVVARVVHVKGRVYLHGNGDEFAVLLPNSSTDEAVAIANRICTECRAVKIDDLPTPTVSIGVATLPTHAPKARQLEEAANEAQRRAKAEGKDRVVAATS
jgi:diguanylate cyclase (GGDEF)-like protein